MRTEILLAAAGGLVAIGYPTLDFDRVALAPRVEAQTQDGEFRWTGRVAAGKTLEIRGVNGEIRVEAASGAEAEVLARKSGQRSDPASVEIAVVPHDGGVTI